MHGTLHAKGDPDAPTCLDCHDKHAMLSRALPDLADLPAQRPRALCGSCHREGEKAARRVTSRQHDIVRQLPDEHPRQGAHRERPARHGDVRRLPHGAPRAAGLDDPEVERPPRQRRRDLRHSATTASRRSSSAASTGRATPRPTRSCPTCEDCHTSHTISRTDQDELPLPDDGPVRALPRGGVGDLLRHLPRQGLAARARPRPPSATTATARTTSCRPTTRPRRSAATTSSRPARKCHEGAHRQFAGYLTHATHHDPEKYPWLFWTFWGMTALLVGTLVVRPAPHARLAVPPLAESRASGGRTRRS